VGSDKEEIRGSSPRRNILGISDSEHQRTADIPTPLRLASGLGLADQAGQERAARNRKSSPQGYLVLASRAFERGKLDETELAQLLEDPELARNRWRHR